MPQFDWPPKPIPNITAAIRDAGSKKASFRRNAAIALRRAADDQLEPAIDALSRLLEDPERTVRIEAAYSAASLCAASLAPKVAPLIESDDPDQRAAALEFTAAAGGAEDVSRLESVFLDDPDAVVRCIALESLSALDPDSADAACRSLLERVDEMIPVIRTAMVILRSAGDKGDASLFARHLDDQRPGVCLEAAASLAYLEDPRGIPRLLSEALDPSGPDERAVALEGLCRTTNRQVLDAARKRLSSLFARRDEKIYWASILASSGDSRALGRVRTQLQGSDPLRAAAAMRAAGLCSLSSLVPPLVRVIDASLGGDETALVLDSIEALGLMRCPEAADALRSISENPKDEDLADHAAAALDEVKRWI
jgi:HEAT repeat protein